MKHFAREMAPAALVAGVVLLLPAGAELLGLGAFEMLLALLALASVGVGVLALLVAAFTRRKRQPLRVAAGCAVFVVLCYPCIKLSLTARRVAFARLATRSQKVVAAIASYERENGSPPESLQSLVPAYIDHVPTTGLPAYPAYEYEVFPAAATAWELRVLCSSGFMNGDIFFFWPGGRYPASTGAGSVERIEDWAYLHE